MRDKCYDVCVGALSVNFVVCLAYPLLVSRGCHYRLAFQPRDINSEKRASHIK